MSTAATISIPDTLALLDGPFRKLADGVTENRYALWLGSGISFGRVDGLSKVVPRVLEHLRSRIVATDATCVFRTALTRILELAGPTDAERLRFDYAVPFSSWPDAESLTKRLINKYSSVLQVHVNGQKEDYLLWDGIDIVSTFANPLIEPDVEHLCIAILILEGVSSDIASANWDGLIEKAATTLADNPTALVVCVTPEELQQQPGRAQLFKFHGCAIKAAANQHKYREFMVGRLSQINRWPNDYPAMANKLTTLIASKPTLMIGLSAQDSNIQGIFSRAERSVRWDWPGDRPSIVFSASELGIDQSALLENVYRTAYTGADHEAIEASATFPAYGKPLLLSLVLHVLSSKLCALLDQSSLTHFCESDKEKLRAGIRALRDMLGRESDADRMSFVSSLIHHLGRLMGMFRGGQVPTLPNRYLPITGGPVQAIPGDQFLQTSGLPEAAVAASIIGALEADGRIQLKASDTTAFGAGALNIESSLAPGKVFFAANGNAALRLWNNGLVADQDDTILIHSLEIVPSQARSPRGSPGRTGIRGLREVSMSKLIEESGSCDELLLRFRQEVGV